MSSFHLFVVLFFRWEWQQLCISQSAPCSSSSRIMSLNCLVILRLSRLDSPCTRWYSYASLSLIVRGLRSCCSQSLGVCSLSRGRRVWRMSDQFRPLSVWALRHKVGIDTTQHNLEHSTVRWSR